MKKIIIGKINSVFGIRGEVKILSYCQVPADIEKYKLFDKNDNEIKIKISNKNKTVVGTSGTGGAILIAKIAGVEDRNKAESLRGAQLFTNRDDFKELSSDEFYQVDLIGLDVVDDTSQKIGKVLNVFDFGGGTMLEIEFEKENPKMNLEKIENFPFKNAIFPEVNVKAGFVRISFPDIVKID